MSLSLLLTIYIVFILIYAAVMGFAVFKVFMFARNKQLKGYSRRMTFAFIATIFFIIFTTFIVIRSYNWNDTFTYYCSQLTSGSCFCEINSDAQKACQAARDAQLKQSQTLPVNGASTQLPTI